MILNGSFNHTLRPMKYPQFYEMFRNAIKNTWTVEEIDFSRDIPQLRKFSEAEKHMVQRLVAFFATGDSIVGKNLVLQYYQRINSPEARMYLGRQLYEEQLHVQFYLTLLDTYVPDHNERAAAFDALKTIPSIARKGEWMERYIEQDNFLLNLIAFACCVEGLFFYGAFAYIFFMKERGLLPGLADGTNWVMRDETMHMEFAFSVIDVIKAESPELWEQLNPEVVRDMLRSAVDVEAAFAKDALSGGIAGLSAQSMREYLESVADERLKRLGYSTLYNTRNPYPFMAQQGMMNIENFFERRVSSYQTNVEGTVRFDEEF